MFIKWIFYLSFTAGLSVTALAQDNSEEDVDPESVIEDLNDAAEESEVPSEYESGEPSGYESEQETEDPASVLDEDSIVDQELDAADGDAGIAEDQQYPAMEADAQPTSGTRVFGDYKIHIGASKPEFDKSDEYELVYGNSRFYPTLSVEYFFFDWYATLGLIFRLGYYKDDGHAVIQDGDSYVSDKRGETELTLVPLQTGLTAQLTPFPAKWITLGGWFAGEATYFQEIRKGSGSDVASSGTTSSEDESSTKSSGSGNEVLTNVGWRYATNVGVSLSFLLNGLDETSVKSLHPIGIGSVYFTPYVEATTGTFTDSGLTFERIAYGAAFTFETL